VQIDPLLNMTNQAKERMIWLKRWRCGENGALFVTAMLALMVLAPSFNVCLAAAPFTAPALVSSSFSASSLAASATVSEAALTQAVRQWLHSSLVASSSSLPTSTGFSAGIETPVVHSDAVALPPLHLTPYCVEHGVSPVTSLPQRDVSRWAVQFSLPPHEAATRSGVRTNSFPQ